MEQKTYQVIGMHCASCANIISKKLSKERGVVKADVNFATETAQLALAPDAATDGELNAAIEPLGYRLMGHGAAPVPQAHDQLEHDHGDHLGLGDGSSARRKIYLVLLAALAIFALMMWDIAARVFPAIPKLPIAMATWNSIGLIIASGVLALVGKPFLLGVARFMRYGAANMDTLIGIGTMSAYLYSAAMTLFPWLPERLGLPEATYFDVVVVVIGFVAYGKYLEAQSKRRTGDAIRKLIGLQAKTALVWREGKETEIPLSEVAVGDVVIVKPGAKIPVDGVILEGTSSIDESMMTGESIPVDKKSGDNVMGGTMNKQGSFRFRAAKIGTDTLLAQIIKMVEQAQGSKAPIQALADRISGVFVPIVLGVATMSVALWFVFGIPALGFSQTLSYAILSFVGVLVIACPCALGLATPTAIIAGVGKGAERGILIKNAEALERLSKVNVVVFDKTGTITKGTPEVTDIGTLDQAWTSEMVLRYAASIEQLSEHPLAQAIVRKARAQQLRLDAPKDFSALEGIGVKAVVGDTPVFVHKPDAPALPEAARALQAQGKTVVMVEVDGKEKGFIALSDTLKPEAQQAIQRLHQEKIRVVMLTGDNRLSAQHIANLAHIDQVIAEVLPNEKAEKIKALQREGNTVAMAGDGINDAPALAQADVGIAMATGTDVAIESAGITLLHGDLQKLSGAIRLSRMTLRTVKQNLFWAFVYNVVGIPVAAGALYPLWGIVLNPVFAGLAMAFSSVSVVSNSLRLKSKTV